MTAVPWTLRCVACAASYDGLERRYVCGCGGTLDVIHADRGSVTLAELAVFDARRGGLGPRDRSGVWRFREIVLPLPEGEIVTKPEGNTNLYRSRRLSSWVGLDALDLKHEGENPTGSFKDRGMTVAISVARKLGAKRVVCASTGNTSASMASYAAAAGLDAYVLIPEGNVAYGKLSQALAYGAKTIQIAGDFDAAMRLVLQVGEAHDVYVVNSVNPFRIEGQKAIAFELLQDLGWNVPDWIVLPGGNLGNSAAIYKGLDEFKRLGFIRRLPKIAVVQAEGAAPLARAFATGQALVPERHPETRATAIKIGDPVSWQKSLRGVVATGGTVIAVSDQEILDAKAQVDASGIGAEPASCATVAGVRRLVASGVIPADAHVCGILTGHVLKDPEIVVAYHRGTLDGITSTFANPPVQVPATLDAVLEAMAR